MRMVFLILFFMGRGKLNNTFLGHAHKGSRTTVGVNYRS